MLFQQKLNVGCDSYMQIHKQAELDRDNGGGVVACQAMYDWALISRQGRPLLHSLLNKSSATL